jgi:hypothetical protein
MMRLFRTRWTPHEADEWTREDYWAIVFSSISYVLMTVCIALLFVRPLWGVLSTIGSAVFAWLMYRVIDPKLRTLSEEYETKQKEYLHRLDKVMKWEED